MLPENAPRRIPTKFQTAPHADDPQANHKSLKAMSDLLPFVEMAGVVALDGTLAHSALSFPANKIFLGDRDYVSYYLKGGQAPVYFSSLNRNKVDDKWQINVSRPMRDANGTLIGIQIAAIDLDYLREELFSNFRDIREDAREKRNHYRISVIDRDKRILVREPETGDDIGKSLARGPLIQRLASSNAEEVAGPFKSVLEGDVRVGVSKWLANKKFIITASRPLDEVLQRWRQQAAVAGTISFVFFSGLIFLRVRTMKYERTIEDHTRSLAAMNAALTKQTRLAQGAAEAKARFLANMSHEIRTPLTGIIGYAGLALEDESLSEQTRHYLKLTFNAGNHLRGIIDDILDLSKIEAGKIELDLKPYSVSALVDHSISYTAPGAKAKGLEFRRQVDPAIPPWLMCDRFRIQQVMLNLLNNAIKFTERGFIEVAAALERKSDGEAEIRFSVRDTGIGIAPDKMSQLFREFQQVDDSISRRYGGTGLGLAISKALVTAMHGTIGVESTPGQGSVFWFKLPLRVAAAPVAEPPEPEPGEIRRPLDLLVVDDSEMNAELAEALLLRLGHRVDRASDGQTAIECCSRKNYDLVFMDIQMPGMDGIEATRRIRTLNDHTRQMPIVAMTANVMPDQVAEYRKAGMTDHVGKPLDRKRIQAVLALLVKPAVSNNTAPTATAAGGGGT